MKPILNLDEVDLESREHGNFASSHATIGARIGAKKLGYNLTVVPPGKKSFPKHNHRNNEEMFLILDGVGELRFGDDTYPLRKHDIVCCPPGGPEVSHQILNTGTGELKYLALSTTIPMEVVEYPDSNKLGVMVGEWPKMDLRMILKADPVDYFDGES